MEFMLTYLYRIPIRREHAIMLRYFFMANKNRLQMIEYILKRQGFQRLS